MTMPDVKIEKLRTGPVSWSERLRRYALLIRLHKPIGILLLLWPSLWALWVAGAGQPPWQIVLIFVAGVALMRSAGCAINDFADRHIDGHVARTRERPVASGLVSPAEALGVFVILSLIAFCLLFFLNWQTMALSVGAAMLAAAYPFMKRYTHLPQVVLGAAFGWAVPMAFMAVTQSMPPVAWVIFAATLLWALIYDTQYAMVDREDDLKIGVKSTAILFGRHDLLIIGLLQVIMLLLLILTGWMTERGWIFYAGLLVGGGFFLYQQAICRERSPKACFEAFLNNNHFGMAVFLGLLLDYALA
ncbi:MAG: 4-hydroxybenzoate octaprenyltransferase [Gammaproteobacteria bacterium]|nr:4-hydroxybenzoate octaprenyltransferase [Gammaproteobacteria bacterium]